MFYLCPLLIMGEPLYLCLIYCLDSIKQFFRDNGRMCVLNDRPFVFVGCVLRKAQAVLLYLSVDAVANINLIMQN